MKDKEIYRELCEKEESIPLFSQAWWMDATCGESNWDVLLVRDRQGSICAALPYLLKRKWGLKFICQPQLTQTNGIWFRPTSYKNEYEKFSKENQMAQEVINQLEAMKLAFFVQCFHHKFTNWLPFYWKGYRQTTRYTYRIDDISDDEALFQRFSEAKKRHIRKAQRNGLTLGEMEAETFYDFCCTVHEKHGEKNLLPRELILRCISAAKREGKGKIITIQDQDGHVHSALFLCWDQQTAYYLVPATLPEYKTSGASSLLVWEAIQEAKKHVQAFDFEGSMEENIENSYRQYGTRQIPYFKISKGLLSRLF